MRHLLFDLRRSVSSTNRNARSATVMGRLLGVAFVVCILTGLYSHFLQQPYSWMHFPTHPVSLYKWSQGVHITVGIACFPLLLGKLYTIFPQLFQSPPIKSIGHVFERASITLFVSSSLVQIFTGLLNTFQYYPWPFPFKQVHFALSFVIIGSLAIHIALKLPLITRYWTAKRSYDANGEFIPPESDLVPVTPRKQALERLAALGVDPTSAAFQRDLDDPTVVLDAEVSSAAFEARRPKGFVARIFAWIDDTPSSPAKTSRRGFFTAVTASTVGVVALTAGQSFKPFDTINVLAPRQQGLGPNDLPINRTAAAAQVLETAMDPNWGLTISKGAFSVRLSAAQLLALPQHQADLPISCVEGWSQMATWRGVRLVDLVALVDADASASLKVTSLEKKGGYRIMMMGSEYVHDPNTLVATHLNGERLDIEHGYPARMIAPGRPGVLQTKWLSTLEVL
ncbi:molybdopterin-dependent oxidoreductase [Frondihabitans cladoniiphilus]|uniref:Molybdopterin-dependent oxidoreductase n=1 Tax=Frondihabitans cladoniiphilus TaxID=715785 RepID=A0ABP8VTY1_9MICO